MAQQTVPASLLLVLGFLALCVQGIALEPEDVLFFKTGPLSLRPQVAIAEAYNDNIFYQNANQVEDFITSISPGLKLQLGRPEHNYLAINYTLDELFYFENPRLDAGQHSFEFRNQIELERFKVVGSDRFQLLSSPLGGVVERVVSTNGLAIYGFGNVERTVFDDVYTLSYDIGEKTAAYVRGTHNSSDYQQGVALYDIQSIVGTVGFGYRPFSKTIVFGEVYYGQTSTEPNSRTLPSNPRLASVGGYLGARGNFTPKLSGMVKVGYEWREFSDGSEPSSDPVADMTLTQRFSDKTSLALTYSHLSAVSIQYSRQTYTAETIGLQLTQILGTRRKWQATVGGNYSIYDYQQSGGASSTVEYNYLRGSFNLAYQVQRWLTANCGYDFEHVTGDSGAVPGYDVNRVTLRLAIGY